ncbi:Putative cytoplasmic protein [Salmonella enterica subsp. arizonae]|uniref:Cytoplasmic protein n=1 Tax=Salmonella enterica subsp. arizonae TaxID=59203 RepID=A0A379SJF2_SALER|nr:Putative cytoplasmic protein [Salmonella enterica subsp. arizonae]
MSHLRIPANWKVKRSTPFFTKENVPAALLSHHNTAAGRFRTNLRDGRAP